jgi:hypothetical protein
MLMCVFPSVFFKVSICGCVLFVGVPDVSHHYADLDNVQEYNVPSLLAPPYSGGSADVLCYILVSTPTTAFSIPPKHDHRP